MKGCAFLRDRKGDERGTFGVLMAVGLTLLLQLELAVENVMTSGAEGWIRRIVKKNRLGLARNLVKERVEKS